MLKVWENFGFYENELGEGASTLTHDHKFPHITLLRDPARADVLAGPDGPVLTSREYPAGGIVRIPAGVWHRFTALGPRLRYVCTWLHRNVDGEVVEEFDGYGYE